MKLRGVPALRRRRPAIVLTALVAALSILVPTTLAAKPLPGPVSIQILDISDWHGQLDPIGGVGGAAVISSYWQADRAANPNTLTVTAGDDFGASPPLSNFFEEVPAVLAQRMMGIDFGTFGNHNFDRGLDHLQEMIDIARDEEGEFGEPYSYVSANLSNLRHNLRNVSPYQIVKIGGLKVAVIGITNPEAPTLVFPGSFGSIVITDPVAAANAARADARAKGAEIVVAITHLGVRGFENGQPFGEIVDFANGVTGFDVIFGDHTDIQFSGVINGQQVVENRSKGITYSRTNLTFVPGTGVSAVGNTFVSPVASAVTPDPAIQAMLQPYRDQLGPIFNTVVGESNVFIPRSDSCGRSDGRLCESLIGNTVTDSMRLTYGTDFAITNSGGLRADLTCPTTDNPNDFCPGYTPPPYPITRGQVNTVLPFGNVVVTLTVNGAELKTMLENGVSAVPGANGRFAQVSGLCFTYDIAALAGSRVTGAVRQALDGSCTGAAVDLTAASSYSIAENDFMASGGDGYPNFSSRTVSRDIMDQVLADWISANTPISASIQGRIVCTDSNGATAPNCSPITAP